MPSVVSMEMILSQQPSVTCFDGILPHSFLKTTLGSVEIIYSGSISCLDKWVHYNPHNHRLGTRHQRQTAKGLSVL